MYGRHVQLLVAVAQVRHDGCRDGCRQLVDAVGAQLFSLDVDRAELQAPRSGRRRLLLLLQCQPNNDRLHVTPEPGRSPARQMAPVAVSGHAFVLPPLLRPRHEVLVHATTGFLGGCVGLRVLVAAKGTRCVDRAVFIRRPRRLGVNAAEHAGRRLESSSSHDGCPHSRCRRCHRRGPR